MTSTVTPSCWNWIELVTDGWPEAARDLGNTLVDNPGRISRAYRSLLAGYSIKPHDVLKITMETPHDGTMAWSAPTRSRFFLSARTTFCPSSGR